MASSVIAIIIYIYNLIQVKVLSHGAEENKRIGLLRLNRLTRSSSSFAGGWRWICIEINWKQTFICRHFLYMRRRCRLQCPQLPVHMHSVIHVPLLHVYTEKLEVKFLVLGCVTTVQIMCTRELVQICLKVSRGGFSGLLSGRVRHGGRNSLNVNDGDSYKYLNCS